MSTKQLAGKVAYVTGGGRGIGAAVARRLAEEGADVAFTYLKSAERAAVVVDELKQLGVRVAAYQADQTDPAAAAAAVQAAAAEFGHLDIVVNNSGIFRGGAIDDADADPAALAEQWAVNVFGTVATTREAIKHMRPGGRVILTGSVAGGRASAPGVADYAATKAALEAYGRGWARDLAPRQITVNTLILGTINTDMALPPDSEFGAQVLAGIPLGRYGEANEVASLVDFVVSPAAAFMTGASILVDGGWSS